MKLESVQSMCRTFFFRVRLPTEVVNFRLLVDVISLIHSESEIVYLYVALNQSFYLSHFENKM